MRWHVARTWWAFTGYLWWISSFPTDWLLRIHLRAEAWVTSLPEAQMTETP